jgi:hypothetical protein
MAKGVYSAQEKRGIRKKIRKIRSVVTLRFMDISLYQQQKKGNRPDLPVLATTNFKFFLKRAMAKWEKGLRVAPTKCAHLSARQSEDYR